MKLLLCHPSQRVSFDGIKARPMVGPPLGIMQIAAYVRASGWPGTVEIYDARLSAGFHRAANGETGFGDDDETVRERLRDAAPDVIGISNMFTAQIGRAYRMAEVAREACPEATIVIGGPHVSVFPLEALAHPAIDFVVMGEGEVRMAQLLDALAAGRPVAIEGVVGKLEDMRLLRRSRHSPITFVEPLDDLPLPAYDLVDLEAYFDLAARGYSPRYREWGHRAMSLLTSRGCPHKCVFCSIQTTMGYKFRAHSPAYVERHLQHLREHYGVDCIHFEDDNLCHVPERYDAILDMLIRFEPRIAWDTPNGIRGDVWTRERVRRTKESGCKFLTVAVESGVQRVLDEVVKKRLDLARVEDLMRWCHALDLRLHAFYIIGFPGETAKEMQTTVDYALDRYRRFGVTPFLQPLIPIPGTAVYDRIMAEKLYAIPPRPLYNQVTTSDFCPNIVRRIYKSYLRDRLIMFARRTLTSRNDFVYNIRLVATYPQAVVHALRNLVGAVG